MILDFIASYAVLFELLFDLNIKNRLKDYFEIWLVNVVHLKIKTFRVCTECALKAETMGMS